MKESLLVENTTALESNLSAHAKSLAEALELSNKLQQNKDELEQSKSELEKTRQDLEDKTSRLTEADE